MNKYFWMGMCAVYFMMFCGSLYIINRMDKSIEMTSTKVVEFLGGENVICEYSILDDYSSCGVSNEEVMSDVCGE